MYRDTHFETVKRNNCQLVQARYFETDASLASSGNCRHWATGLGGRQAAHRTGDRERQTAERAATMSWYDEVAAAGRSKSLTTGNVRCGVAAVHEVLGSLALETPVNCHSELMEDSLRNIEPVQLGVEQMCQASVELPSITDDTGPPYLARS